MIHISYHIYIYYDIYIYILIYTYMIIYIYTYDVYIYICTWLNIRIHTYACIHTYIHTYITLHYITLHYITLHYITLHYITLHYIHTYIYTCICDSTHTHSSISCYSYGECDDKPWSFWRSHMAPSTHFWNVEGCVFPERVWAQGSSNSGGL